MEYCVGPAMAIDWGDEPPPRWNRRLVGRVTGYFRPYWRRGLAAGACLATQALVGLIPAVVTLQLVNYLCYPRPGRTLGHAALLVGIGLAAPIVVGLFSVAEAWFSVGISQRLMTDLRGQLFSRLLGQSVGFFTKTRLGDVMSRIGDDVDRIEDVVTDTILGLFFNVIVVVATVGLMVALDWRLALVALVGVPLVVIPSRWAGRVTYQARKASQRQRARVYSYLQEILGISGLLLVKAFAMQPYERRRFGELNEELRRRELRRKMIGRWFYVFIDVLQTAAPALVWLYGSYLVLANRATIGTVVTFLTFLMFRLYGAVAELANLHVNAMGSLALFHRIFQVLDRPIEVVDRPDARQLEQVRGAITFEDVTFAYAPGLRPALQEVSFQAEPGQLVALVGPTGAGKTTVTYLASRFYDPQQGCIRVDGHDLRDVTLASLERHVGIVFQDAFMFHASLRENLRYARADAGDEELVAAAKAAYLHDFVESLPEGYDTIVGERGHRLSGGEKQRVALARVILKDPRILILDEATAHLDTVSEQLIQAALRPLFVGRTSLVIAHRLSTILAADQILVLDHSRVVERGTHLELLSLGGLYARLYERQFEAQAAQLGPAGASPLGLVASSTPRSGHR